MAKTALVEREKRTNNVNKRTRSIEVVLNGSARARTYLVFYKILYYKEMICQRCKGRRVVPYIEIIQVNKRGKKISPKNPSTQLASKEAIRRLAICGSCQARF